MNFDYIWIVFFAILGLVVGSFLNVVIYRLPKMMEQDWQSECREMMGVEGGIDGVKYTLSQPSSSCPCCSHKIKWYENIPVLSFLFLRGKCASCGVAISIRYPIIELVTAFLFAVVSYKNHDFLSCLAWSFFVSVIISLTFIDWDNQILPDNLNYILLWGGLIGSYFGWTGVASGDAILGAFLGYSSLFLITKIFFVLTGKQGMGNGDFKLYAALGAWFGWYALVPIILFSCVVGIFVGVSLKMLRSESLDSPIPFGPFLAGAGLLLMIFGVSGALEFFNF